MKSINKKGLVAAILTFVVGAGAVLTANVTEGTLTRTDYPLLGEHKAVTVLMYINGSDLESEAGMATENLQAVAEALSEMGEAASSVNVVVETGGTELWYTPGLSQNSRFVMTASGPQAVEGITPRNMGHPDTLTDFLSFGVRSYPADRYVLLFWNHGGGAVAGFGSDELYGHDSLTLAELHQAFSHNAVADFIFELIGFDACLMATAETAAVLAPWGRYMVASQELEPAEGWDYRWLEALADSTWDGLSLGRDIAERYIAAESRCAKTLSVIDLSALPDLEAALSPFLELAGENGYLNIAQNRTRIKAFGISGRSSDILDLLSLAKTAGISDTSDLEAALLRAVPVNLRNETAEEGCGLTVYLPSGDDPWLSESVDTYNKAPFLGAYRSFALGYAAFLQEESGYSAQHIKAGFDGAICTATFPDAEQIAGAYLTLFFPVRDGYYALLGTDSDVTLNPNGTATAVFDWLWLSIDGQPLCSIEKQFDGKRLECVSPVLLNGEIVWLEILFNSQNPDGCITGAVPMNSERASRTLALAPKDTLIPLYPLEDFTSGLAPLSGEDIYDGYIKGELVTIPEHGELWIERLGLEADELLGGFMVVDLAQGQSYTEFVKLTSAALKDAA